MRRSNLWITAGALTALAAAGCSSDPGEIVVPDLDTILDIDVSDTETSTDTVPDTTPDGSETDEGGTCETPCTALSQCREAGFENPECADGCCRELELELCEEHLQPCDDDSFSTDTFFCDTQAGLCLALCNADTADNTRSEDCPLNSYCFELNGATTDLNGACIPGDCETNIFDPESCGVDGTCFAVGNGASFCIDAGTALEGEPCGLTEDGAADDTCAPGMLCSANVCVLPCDRQADDPGCDDGEECLAAFDFTQRNRPGICGVECTPFSAGECPAGQVCEAITGRFGVNVWACTDDTVTDPVGVGEECDSTDDNCGEGLVCVTDGDTATCMQFCDSDRDSEETFSLCPRGDSAGADLTAVVGYEEVTEPLALPAGPVSAEVRTAGGGFVAAIETELSADESVAFVAYESGAGVAFLELEDFATEPPTGGVRVIHAVPNVASAELSIGSLLIDGAGLGYSEGAAAAGTDLRITSWGDAEAPVTDVEIDSTDLVGLSTVVVAQVGDSTVVVDVASDTGAPSLQFLHAIPGGPNVDVYLDCTPFSDCTTGDRFAANVAAGATSIGGFIEATAGAHTATIVLAGADPADFSTSDVIADGAAFDVAATEPTLAFAFAGAGGPALGAASFGAAADGTINVGFINGTTETLDVVNEDGSAQEPAFQFGDVFPREGEYAAVPRGTYFGFLRAADGELIYATPAISLPVDTLATIIVNADAAGENWAASGFFDEYVPAGAGGTIRVYHAAQGAPEVKLTGPGESEFVCVERIDGFGLCDEACQPYPRGGDYGCSDPESSCLPYRYFEGVEDGNEIVPTEGFCTGSTEGAAAFATCSNPGFFDAACADMSACLTVEEGSNAGVCTPLCEPFGAEGQCPEGASCSGILPLLGQLDFSFCFEDAQAGAVGDCCADEGLACAADFTFCFDNGAGAACTKVCRVAFGDDDCPTGTECTSGLLNPEVVPPYMGICQ